MAKYKIRIEGKIYTRAPVRTYERRDYAEFEARRLREKGYNVRIIRSERTGQLQLFRRKKK